MKCPNCGSTDSTTLRTDNLPSKTEKVRWRSCKKCYHVYMTIEQHLCSDTKEFKDNLRKRRIG